MAIAFVAATAGFTGTASLTVSGTNPVVVAWVNKATSTPDAPTYNGVPLIRLPVAVAGPSGQFGWMYYLVAPATGSNTCSLGSGYEGMFACYSGVDQTQPTDVFIKATGQNVTYTLNLSGANEWIVTGGNTIGAGSLSAGTGATNRGGGGPTIMDSNGGLSAGSQGITVNDSANAQMGIGISLKPSGAASSIAFMSESNTTSGGTTTLAHTVIGPNPALVVFVEMLVGGTISSVLYNGVAMTLMNSGSSNTVNRSYILINPSLGSNTISVTASGTVVRIIALSYRGVMAGAGTGGSDASAGNQSTSSGTLTAGLTVTQGAWALQYVIGQNAGPNSVGVATTDRTGSVDASFVYDTNGLLSSGLNNITATWTSDPAFAQLAVALKPYVAAVTAMADRRVFFI